MIVHDGINGDLISFSSVLRAIRQHFKNSRIVLQHMRITSEILKNCPYIDEKFADVKSLHWIPDIRAVFVWNITLAKDLLPFKLDIAFCFGFHRDSTLLSYMSDAKKIIIPDQPNFLSIINPIFPFDPFKNLITHLVVNKPESSQITDQYLAILDGFFKNELRIVNSRIGIFHAIYNLQ